MDLSILCVSFRSSEDTLRCFRSLEAGGADGLEWEFLLGDNGSGDCSALSALQSHPRIRMLPGSENLGFGRENNRLATQARGKFLLCLNPDTLVPPRILSRLVVHLKAHPECGACAPLLVNADGSPQFSWNRDMGLAWELAECAYLQNPWRRRQERRMRRQSPEGPWSVDFASGAALCVPRSAWLAVEGFDPDFFLNHEDIDLCRRLRSISFEVHVLPDCSVTHLDGGTQRKDWTRFVADRLDAKWIALGKAFRGPSLPIAQALWFLGASLRLAIACLLPGESARQRRRGYLNALRKRLRP